MGLKKEKKKHIIVLRAEMICEVQWQTHKRMICGWNIHKVIVSDVKGKCFHYPNAPFVHKYKTNQIKINVYLEVIK